MNNGRFNGTDRYVATDDLAIAVNAAATLGRPLLVKGEPGTGKTMLAVEVARALGREPPRGGGSHAARGAGDQGDLVAQSGHVRCSFDAACDAAANRIQKLAAASAASAHRRASSSSRASGSSALVRSILIARMSSKPMNRATCSR